jgi:hypothetical protein
MNHHDMSVVELSADIQRSIQRLDPEIPGLSTLGKHQLRTLMAGRGDVLNQFRLILDRARKARAFPGAR